MTALIVAVEAPGLRAVPPHTTQLLVHLLYTDSTQLTLYTVHSTHTDSELSLPTPLTSLYTSCTQTVYSTQYTHCIQCTHCIQNTVQTLYTVHRTHTDSGPSLPTPLNSSYTSCTHSLYSTHCIQYKVHTLLSTQYTLYATVYTLYTVHSTHSVYTVHTLTMDCATPHPSAPCTVHLLKHTVYSTQYLAH